ITAQAAFQQADYVGWNIWASLTNRPLLPFRYQHLGEFMSLGVDNATLTGLGMKMEGTLGYVARRAAYLYRLPTLEHKLKVGFNWLTRPIIETLSS
ncbi:MAG: NAD(P)/FAD-dependent oxidoreductase, partial [Rivularia sp. (in: cyanobacteria)]